MPDNRRRNCADPPRGCGKNHVEVGPISWRGLCETCGALNMNRNYDDLVNHHGDGFDHWRRRVAAAVGGTLLDDLRNTA